MQTRDKVSIQLPLGGHTFSLNNLPACDVEQVEIILDTHKVTLAPQGAVSPESAYNLLRIVGKGCSHREQSVCSELNADIVAAMAIDSKALAAIVERFGDRASFTSPLLDMRHSEEACLTLDITEQVCYMRLFENGLRRAKAYKIASADDVLYYVCEWIGEQDAKIFVKGGQGAAKLLAKYYKRVVCE